MFTVYYYHIFTVTILIMIFFIHLYNVKGNKIIIICKISQYIPYLSQISEQKPLKMYLR